MNMQWLHEPPQWEQDGNRLSVTAAPRTDFWRKTHDGGVRDNGHFYFGSVSGDFTAQARIEGDYVDQYDQAGLMVRLDETVWLKCGIELNDGIHYASVVVTRQWSDWSVVPLVGNEPIWIRLVRHGATFEVHRSFDAQDFTMMRQTYLTETAAVDVGPMIAAPTGRGFRATFTELLIQQRREIGNRG